jgi:hypothetical protein
MLFSGFLNDAFELFRRSTFTHSSLRALWLQTKRGQRFVNTLLGVLDRLCRCLVASGESAVVVRMVDRVTAFSIVKMLKADRTGLGLSMRLNSVQFSFPPPGSLRDRTLFFNSISRVHINQLGIDVLGWCIFWLQHQAILQL